MSKNLDSLYANKFCLISFVYAKNCRCVHHNRVQRFSKSTVTTTSTTRKCMTPSFILGPQQHKIYSLEKLSTVASYVHCLKVGQIQKSHRQLTNKLHSPSIFRPNNRPAKCLHRLRFMQDYIAHGPWYPSHLPTIFPWAGPHSL